MNVNTRIRMLKTLRYTKLIRIRWGYTYATFIIMLLTWFFVFNTYLDTSLLLPTKVVLILIQLQIWILLLTKFDWLNLMETLRLVYWFILAPKLYIRNEYKNEYYKYEPINVRLTSQEDIEDMKNMRKVIMKWDEPKRIWRIPDKKKEEVVIQRNTWHEVTIKDVTEENKSIEKSSEKKDMKWIKTIRRL